MACESCGEKPKNTAKDFTKAVIEINNPEALVLLRKVVIPTSMGDEESVPPAIGKYRNVLLQYEANDHIYLYSSDGIPTAITANIPQEILDSIAELEATDVVLQQEIDDLKNSPDVVDIVPTYAALQAYDTSKLGDNDIIRVLQDEQHDGQSTYYRWNATTSSWAYIGAVGDYYTKGQVDTLLASKQNTLTAGSNITIENNVISATGTTYTAGANVQISPENVISATDTTYSAFTGTDGQTAGTAGLVPAPATTDAGKFLKADGTWATAGGGGGGDSVYSTVTTSNSSTGGAVYIGNLDASQDEVTDPTTTDNHYKYFWALPADNTQVPGSQTINICGDIYGGHGNNSNTVIGTGTIGEDGTAWNSTANVMIAPFTQMSTRAQIGNSARTIEAVTIGQGARVNGGAGCVAIGKSASVANGDSTLNSALASMAFGTSANCSTTNSIAMGAYSQPTRSGELNIGGSSNGGGWGYNNTDYRLLGGVHDGLLDHDAATVGQLNGRVKQNAGAPTTSTTGTVGQLLEDTTNGKLYICTDATNPYVWEEVGAGGGGTTEIEYINCTLTGATATGFTLSADKTATQVKALVEAGKEVIYKFVNPTTAGSILAGTYEFSVLFAGTNSSVDVVTGYGMTEVSGTNTQGVYTFNHISSTVTVTAGTIPTVNDATLTIQKNGTTVQTFTANASSNATANIEVPTITMTTTDPGEGSALAADNFVAVYGGDPIIMDYSTSEINTGATWVDGSAIYKKTVNFGTLPNATSKDVAHGISNLGRVVKIEGYAYRSSDSTNFPIPFASEVTGASIGVSVTSTNISIGAGVDRSNITECYVTLYYTKSA